MRLIPVLLLAVALAGCDRGVDLSNASVEDVVAATKDAAKQSPGQWRLTSSVEAVDLGAAAGSPMAAMMKSQIGKPMVTTACVTPEQAKSPAVGDLAQMKGSQCRFPTFVMKAGKIDAVMRCARPTGALTVTQAGAYGSDAYDLRSTVTQEMASGKSSMTLHVVGKRVGDCAK